MARPDLSNVSRVVVRAPNWLGDAILALPAIAAVRRHFASAHVTLAAPPAIAAVFREETDAQPDVVMDVPTAPREVIALMQGGGFDLAILFPNSFRSAWNTWRAGIPARWGYGRRGRGWMLTRLSPRPRQARRRHHAEYFRELVRGLGITCGDEPPRVGVSAQSRARASALLDQRGLASFDDKLIGFAPGAAYGEAKQWMPDRVAAVAARLAREHDAACVVLGASHDRPVARAIESWVHANAPDIAGRVVDLVGQTAIGALAGIAARCRVFVSNDSGAMHLAAAVGRPVVAIFGPTDERATQPIGHHEIIRASVFCRPCLLRDCPIDHRCMKRISVESVYAAVAKQLEVAQPVPKVS